MTSMTTAAAEVAAQGQEVRIPAPEFRGAALALGQCRDLEVALDGAAGTGKTYAALFKVHTLLLRYPGAKALIARKTNTALASTAMATYRDLIHPAENIRYFGGNKIRPAAFEYPNGSLLVVTGLDKPEKIKSLEIDLCFLNEATEMTVDDLEFVRSRLRHGKTPYAQVIMDCNPDAPTHWLNQRMIAGLTTRLVSVHEDNPRYYDMRARDWTAEGRRYIFEVLGGLTGVRLARLRYGLWSAAEGTVYQDAWSRARNVVPAFRIPREWPRYLAIDFGYTHPFVCLWCAIDPDGRIVVYREHYRTHMLVEDHASVIAAASGWFHLLPASHPQHRERPAEWADPLPRAVICDHDAEDRATLERHLGLYTTPAHKTVRDGIQAVAARLLPAGDGRARLTFVDGMLIDRDPELIAAKQPTSTIEEFDMYVWAKGADATQKEEPVKRYDDGLDALRYLVASTDLVSSGVSYVEDIWK
jgi:hypothetical protein